MDISAYFQRVGLTAMPTVDTAGLAVVHAAQRKHIPFENLDVALGRSISLDPDDVFAKLVTAKRGGYCYEQNQLLARVLTCVGFEVRPILARVWLALPTLAPPRTHALNLVKLKGEDWIADAGFGAVFVPPLPVRDGAQAMGPDGHIHRLRADTEFGWMFERAKAAGLEISDLTEFQPQYSFTSDTAQSSDMIMSNHWSSTWPQSRFVMHRVASIVTETGIVSFTDHRLTRTSGQQNEITDIATPAQLQKILHTDFAMTFSLSDCAKLLGHDK
jgi:N-hydroxyarylamine O-acetyltransferase